MLRRFFCRDSWFRGKQVVFFDLNGTIVNTNPYWFMSNVRMLEKRQILVDTHRRKKLQEFRGLSLVESCFQLKKDYQLDESIDELVAEQKQEAHRYMLGKGGVDFFPGFVKFWESLAIMQHRTGLVSNIGLDTFQILDEAMIRKRDGFGLQKERSWGMKEARGGLRSIFQDNIFIQGMGVEIRPKPSPDLYLMAMEKMEVSAEDCVAIEDSKIGMIAAEDAGIEVVQFGRDFRSYSELLNEINDVIIE